MDGLLVVIAIIISIVKFSAKQQNQNRGNVRKQPYTKKQNPLPQWLGNPHQPDRTARNMGSHWDKEIKGAVESASSSMPACGTEGIEIEDRSRTGSLNYTEQSNSLRGMSYQRIKPEQKKRKEKKAVPKTEIIEKEPIFDITEENLLRSIVMAEVLGPPRAMKRNIR